jgi:hypothetical protein
VEEKSHLLIASIKSGEKSPLLIDLAKLVANSNKSSHHSCFTTSFDGLFCGKYLSYPSLSSSLSFLSDFSFFSHNKILLIFHFTYTTFISPVKSKSDIFKRIVFTFFHPSIYCTNTSLET